MAEAGAGRRPSLQRQARALGDPTRYRIFRYIAEAETPARIAAIASYLGLHQNAIRQHLAKLCDAGLIEERAGRSRSGRPPLEYRLAPEAAGQWDTPGPLDQLVMLLLDLHRSGLSPRQVAAAAGRLVGDVDGSASAIDHLEAEMERRGFRPRRTETGSRVEMVFDRCSFATPAETDPEVVCEMHWGLAEGILEAGGSDHRVANLIRFDPRWAGCRLVLKPAASGQRASSRPEAHQ